MNVYIDSVRLIRYFRSAVITVIVYVTRTRKGLNTFFCSRSHLGGPRANTTLYGYLYEDLNDYLTLEAGEMREVCFPKVLHRGENRGLCKRNRLITAVQKNVIHLSTRDGCFGGCGRERKYCYVNPFSSCYF